MPVRVRAEGIATSSRPAVCIMLLEGDLSSASNDSNSRRRSGSLAQASSRKAARRFGSSATAAWNSSSSFSQRSASMAIPPTAAAILLCFRLPLLDRIAVIDPIAGEIGGDHEGPDSCEPHLFQQLNGGFQVGTL